VQWQQDNKDWAMSAANQLMSSSTDKTSRSLCHYAPDAFDCGIHPIFAPKHSCASHHYVSTSSSSNRSCLLIDAAIYLDIQSWEAGTKLLHLLHHM
jgi:hypothetical protein